MLRERRRMEQDLYYADAVLITEVFRCKARDSQA